LEHAAAAGPALFQALEQSGLGQALRSSLWLYPAVETLHIVGFALLVGSIVTFDLGVLGADREFDVARWAGRILPLTVLGFLLAVPMGFLLFTAEATAYVRNPVFLAKLALILLALLNVAWFHRGPYRQVQMAGPGSTWPSALKLSALCSLVLWLAVLACGRLIAYV
jgi:hypothetical protein